MLAGFQSQVDSMFPKLRGLVPTDEELKDGEAREKSGRIIVISGYRTEIFDMHVEKERKAYEQRMLDLSRRVQTGRVNILVHDRQLMSRKDGSTGWFSYLEWMEYTPKDEMKDKTEDPSREKKEKRHG